MTDSEARKIEYHDRRRREEWRRARKARDQRVRQIHADLAKLHDLARVFPHRFTHDAATSEQIGANATSIARLWLATALRR